MSSSVDQAPCSPVLREDHTLKLPVIGRDEGLLWWGSHTLHLSSNTAFLARQPLKEAASPFAEDGLAAPATALQLVKQKTRQGGTRRDRGSWASLWDQSWTLVTGRQ